jgi:hypothetical protein
MLLLDCTTHKKTGKDYIQNGSLVFQYKEHTITLEINISSVNVFIDNEDIPHAFKRSVPLIQILYYIRRALNEAK